MSDAMQARFPRAMLLAAAVLVGLALVFVGASRLTGVGTTPNPVAPVVERHALHFEDRPDGAVAVRSAEDGEIVRIVSPGTNGFLRSVLRGLVRARRARDVGSEPPFVLTRWADGRLSLDDPATGRTVELGAFGPSNAEVFAELVTARSATP